MAYEEKDGDITVWHEDQKKNPKGPDFTGYVVRDGVRWRVALWARKSKKDGRSFLSGNVQPPQEKRQEPAELLEDDVPW